jgi:hypothetical protein
MAHQVRMALVCYWNGQKTREGIEAINIAMCEPEWDPKEMFGQKESDEQ